MSAIYCDYMSYSLNSSKGLYGDYLGCIIGVMKGNTRSLGPTLNSIVGVIKGDTRSLDLT